MFHTFLKKMRSLIPSATPLRCFCVSDSQRIWQSAKTAKCELPTAIPKSEIRFSDFICGTGRMHTSDAIGPCLLCVFLYAILRTSIFRSRQKTQHMNFRIVAPFSFRIIAQGTPPIEPHSVPNQPLRRKLVTLSHSVQNSKFERLNNQIPNFGSRFHYVQHYVYVMVRRASPDYVLKYVITY
jgi:hypothetical protein